MGARLLLNAAKDVPYYGKFRAVLFLGQSPHRIHYGNISRTRFCAEDEKAASEYPGKGGGASRSGAAPLPPPVPNAGRFNGPVTNLAARTCGKPRGSSS